MSVVLAYKNQQEQEVVYLQKAYLRHFSNPSAAIVLSQINYWYKPDKLGRPKLRVVKDGVYWLAKSSGDFADECALTVRKVDVAIQVLKDAGLIEVEVHRFNGVPTRHIRVLEAEGKAMLVTDAAVRPALNNVHVVSETTRKVFQNYLEGEYITESTAETTTETTLAEPKINIQEQVQKQTEGKELTVVWSAKERKPLPKSTCKELEAGFKANKAKPAVLSKETISGQVYEVWRYEVPKHTSAKFITPFTGKQCGQAKMLVGKLGGKWETVLRYTLQNWIDFTQYVQSKAGVKLLPQQPNMDFMLKYAAEAMNKYMLSCTPKFQSVKLKPSAISCTTTHDPCEGETQEVPEEKIAVAPKQEDIVKLTYLDVQKILESEDE